MNLTKIRRGGFVWNEVVEVFFRPEGGAWVCQIPSFTPKSFLPKSFATLEGAQSHALTIISGRRCFKDLRERRRLEGITRLGGSEVSVERTATEAGAILAELDAAAQRGDVQTFTRSRHAAECLFEKLDAVYEREEAEARELARRDVRGLRGLGAGDIEELLGLFADATSDTAARLILADKLDDIDRESEAALCRDLGRTIQVREGSVVPRDVTDIVHDEGCRDQDEAPLNRVLGPWDRDGEIEVDSDAPDWAGPYETTVETTYTDRNGMSTVLQRYYQAYESTTDGDREIFRRAVRKDVESRFDDLVPEGDSVVIRYADGNEDTALHMPALASQES